MSDQEMIDRCCLALEQNFKDQIATVASMTFEETKVTLPQKRVWEEYSLTVIKAMREPTEKMIEHARLSRPFIELDQNSRATWIDMIDSIIND